MNVGENLVASWVCRDPLSKLAYARRVRSQVLRESHCCTTLTLLGAYLGLPGRIEHFTKVVVKAASLEDTPLRLVEPDAVAPATAIEREREIMTQFVASKQIRTIGTAADSADTCRLELPRGAGWHFGLISAVPLTPREIVAKTEPLPAAGSTHERR